MFNVIGNTVAAFTKLRFFPWQNLGDILLVGEGNLSFSKSLLQIPGTRVESMMATTFETAQEIAPETVSNARFLRGFGVHVFHDVDAEKLNKSPISGEFDTIVFQFPHVGSREPKYGHNPNHVLVRNFLRNAAAFLKPEGKVMITAVDAPHYDGAFRFEDAAVFAGYHSPEIYPFDPSGFPGYRHSNTNDDESAIKDHRRFATYVFRLKA